jgi:hypothetical protein
LMLAKLRGALKRTCEKSADLGDRELYVVVILKCAVLYLMRKQKYT